MTKQAGAPGGNQTPTPTRTDVDDCSIFACPRPLKRHTQSFQFEDLPVAAVNQDFTSDEKSRDFEPDADTPQSRPLFHFCVSCTYHETHAKFQVYMRRRRRPIWKVRFGENVYTAGCRTATARCTVGVRSKFKRLTSRCM